MTKLITVAFHVLAIFSYVNLFAQTNVTWNAVANGSGVTGTAGTVQVNGVLLPGGLGVNFNSPANTTNLNVPAPNMTFSTFGPMNGGGSQSLSFQFDQPVIVTRFSMADIDQGSFWNDSFIFANGFAFAQATSTNCNAVPTGVTVGPFDLGVYAEFANWTCSGITNQFTINYSLIGGLTHAFLTYSMEVIPVPSLTVCKNDNVNFPAVGNLMGTWTPTTINTDQTGVFSYTFTPNIGQVTTCPIPLILTVNDCGCDPSVTLASPGNDMTNDSPDVVSHIEREFTIFASNIIGVGNNNFEDGVVYHAGNFVELDPGFEVLTGGQFTAEPLGCNGTFDYRQIDNQKSITEILTAESGFVNSDRIPSKFIVIPSGDGSGLEVLMSNLFAKAVVVYALDGKMVYHEILQNSSQFKLDNFTVSKGVYLIAIETDDGQIFTQKFIKN